MHAGDLVGDGRVLLVDVCKHAAGVIASGAGAAHEAGDHLAPAVAGGAGRAELAHGFVELERIRRRIAVDRDLKVRREELPASAMNEGGDDE